MIDNIYLTPNDDSIWKITVEFLEEPISLSEETKTTIFYTDTLKRIMQVLEMGMNEVFFDKIIIELYEK